MFGAFGDNLTTLRNSDFFQWFSLEPEASSDGPAKMFRPSGPAFHDLVALEVLTSKDETLRELRLSIVRSFIDDRRNGAFALDITKSFLRGALGAIPLVRDLEHRLAQGVDIRRADDITPEPVVLSDVEERALETYTGLLQRCEFDTSGFRVRLENKAEPAMLTIAIAAK